MQLTCWVGHLFCLTRSPQMLLKYSYWGCMAGRGDRTRLSNWNSNQRHKIICIWMMKTYKNVKATCCNSFASVASGLFRRPLNVKRHFVYGSRHSMDRPGVACPPCDLSLMTVVIGYSVNNNKALLVFLFRHTDKSAMRQRNVNIESLLPQWSSISAENFKNGMIY